MSAQKGTLPSASLPRVGATVLITQTIKSERGYFVNQLIATRPKQNHPPSSVCAGIFTDPETSLTSLILTLGDQS